MTAKYAIFSKIPKGCVMHKVFGNSSSTECPLPWMPRWQLKSIPQNHNRFEKQRKMSSSTSKQIHVETPYDKFDLNGYTCELSATSTASKKSSKPFKAKGRKLLRSRLTAPTAVQASVEKTVAALGGLDILVFRWRRRAVDAPCRKGQARRRDEEERIGGREMAQVQ